MKYRVQFEETIRVEITVEAVSYEDAVHIADGLKPDSSKHKNLTPRWVDTEQHVDEAGELRHEVIGHCDRCLEPLVGHEEHKTPWIYTTDPDNDLDTICYACHQMRKAAP